MFRARPRCRHGWGAGRRVEGPRGGGCALPPRRPGPLGMTGWPRTVPRSRADCMRSVPERPGGAAHVRALPPVAWGGAGERRVRRGGQYPRDSLSLAGLWGSCQTHQEWSSRAENTSAPPPRPAHGCQLLSEPGPAGDTSVSWPLAPGLQGRNRQEAHTLRDTLSLSVACAVLTGHRHRAAGHCLA